MMATFHSQTSARDAHRGLRLPVKSPYFDTIDLREEATGRDTKLSLKYMDFLIDSWGVSGGNPYAVISWWDSSNVFQSSNIVFMTFADIRANGLIATVTTAVNTYASANTLTVASLRGLPGSVQGSPQAAIADAPADATTNYNTVTTILGSLTGAVNTANTKQNDIATKLNSLLVELRTMGLITP